MFGAQEGVGTRLGSQRNNDGWRAEVTRGGGSICSEKRMQRNEHHTQPERDRAQEVPVTAERRSERRADHRVSSTKGEQSSAEEGPDDDMREQAQNLANLPTERLPKILFFFLFFYRQFLLCL